MNYKKRMNYVKRLINTSVLTSILVTSSVFFNAPATQARPSVRAIIEAGETIGDWIKHNVDDIPIPRKIRINGKSIQGFYNRFIRRPSSGIVYNVCQLQYADGSVSEPYYCDQYGNPI